MLGESIERIIQNKVQQVLTESKEVSAPVDIIQTDNIGEVIEKLVILHTRIWYLEDCISSTTSDAEIADIKRKLDICFKQKRPSYVQAINKMVDNAIRTNESLTEDSVKHYKGFV